MTIKDTEEKATQSADDVASLYSWANLRGTKYRDFSSSREGLRAQSRNPAVSQAGAAGQPADERAAPEVIQEPTPEPDAIAPEAPIFLDRRKAHWERRSGGRPGSETDRRARPSEATKVVPRPPHDLRRAEDPAPGSLRRQAPAPALDWVPPTEHPAWFTSDREARSHPDGAETLQQQERVASRWFAMRGVLDGPRDSRDAGADAALETSRSQPISTLAVFSLAGGVGKSSLVATLGRALAAQGERVFLADASPYGLLPYYFGARELRPGLTRTFSPPGGSRDAPIRLLSVPSFPAQSGEAAADWLAVELPKTATGANRILIDVATASTDVGPSLRGMSPVILMPMIPDMNSVITLSAVDSFFRNQSGGEALRPYYILNQFDGSLPLHLDVREALRRELGDRLLPFVLRRSPAVSEALAEGMTVIDYAPDSPVAGDFLNLANWLRGISAAAEASVRGARWSER